MIRNSVNPCGNIGDLENVEQSSYGFFGKNIPCLIFNTANTEKELEEDEVHVKAICDIAKAFAPDYDAQKVIQFIMKKEDDGQDD